MNTENLNKAIVRMAQGTPEYNRGVLATIGREDIAIEHEVRSRTVMTLCQKRDSMIPDGGHLFEHIDCVENDAAVNAIQRKIVVAVARRDAAWMQIQEMIYKARSEL